jgi:hypothetical protein
MFAAGTPSKVEEESARVKTLTLNPDASSALRIACPTLPPAYETAQDVSNEGIAAERERNAHRLTPTRVTFLKESILLTVAESELD